jgi:AcrR family transcriptional regulator
MLVRKKSTTNATRRRNPERTRDLLLQAAFREIYRSGFQSTGVDTILAATNVTKGALYYHFDSKEALGHAVIEEIIGPSLRKRWLHPLRNGADPIETLISIVQTISVRPEVVSAGCPLNNLAQEMSPLDEGFRKRLAKMFHQWQQGTAMALRKGQSQGKVRRDLDPEGSASFLIAMYEGYVVLAKNAQDPKVLNVGIRNIVGWLRSLQVSRNHKRG